MNNLAAIEREARLTRGMIAELEALTQRFDQALVRAETERNLHLAKIAGERAHLAELIDAAALIVQHLGADVPVEPTHTESEVAAVMAEDAERTAEPSEDLIAVVDSPVETESAGAWLETQFEAADEAGVDAFQSIGEIAAEITAAVADLAADAPATADASDAPEMDDEQVERVEETLASAEPRPARMFNAFAANPFA